MFHLRVKLNPHPNPATYYDKKLIEENSVKVVGYVHFVVVKFVGRSLNVVEVTIVLVCSIE